MPFTSSDPSSRVSPWVQLATMFGVFTAGGFIGWGLASWAAPGSGFAIGVSGMLLPGAFAAGLLMWAGLDILIAIVDLLRGRRRAVGGTLSRRTAAWFVPLSVIFSCAGGVLAGIVPGGQGVMSTTAAYGLAGVSYGVALAWLATKGYLPGPDIG